jgi:hypothetical protein
MKISKPERSGYVCLEKTNILSFSCLVASTAFSCNNFFFRKLTVIVFSFVLLCLISKQSNFGGYFLQEKAAETTKQKQLKRKKPRVVLKSLQFRRLQ